MKTNENKVSNPSKLQLQGISHYGLNVRNMERAEKFYTGILGFPVTMRTRTKSGQQHIEVDAGNVAIALFESPDLDLTAAQKTMTTDGYLHFAFAGDYHRFDEIVQSLKDNGVALDGEPHDWGSGVSIYFPDPDGHQLEIHFDK